jgi:hypothetical protein
VPMIIRTKAVIFIKLRRVIAGYYSTLPCP